MTLEQIRELIEEYGYEDVILFDNFDYSEAFMGVSEDGRAIYDFEKMVDCLMTRENMKYDDATEWIEYNTIRALPYLGSKAPIILYKLI